MTDKPKKPKKDKYEGVPDYSGPNPATGKPWTALEVAEATTVAHYVAWRKATGTLQPTGELDPDEYERTMLVVFAHPQRDLLDVYCKVRGCGKSLGGFTFYDGTWSFIAWGHGGVESDCFTTAPTMNHPPFRLPTRDDRSSSKLKLLVTCPKGHEREVQNWQAMRAIEEGRPSIRV